VRDGESSLNAQERLSKEEMHTKKKKKERNGNNGLEERREREGQVKASRQKVCNEKKRWESDSR